MKSILKLASICFAAAGSAFAVGPVTMTFDDLPSAGADTLPIPADYGGLQWNNFYYEDPLLCGNANSGYGHGMVSASQVAYNPFGDPAIISGGMFDLDSAYLAGAWRDGLQVQVEGFVGSTLVYDNTYTVDSTAATLPIIFNYLGIDSVKFISSGGVYAGYGGTGTHFVIDNLTITIPEPSTFALVGLGAAALMIARRRK